MARIEHIDVKTIADSRGEATIAVYVSLASGASAWSFVPQGKSTGTFEAHFVAPAKAKENADEYITPFLLGKDLTQEELDRYLIELDGTERKQRLGGNTLLGVSLSFSRACSIESGMPLWRYIREQYGRVDDFVAPRLHINLINGGLHAHNGLHIQEYLAIPNAHRVVEALAIGETLYRSLEKHFAREGLMHHMAYGDEGGFAPQFSGDLEPLELFDQLSREAGVRNRLDFGIDAAGVNTHLAVSDVLELYRAMEHRFGITYLEDPFDETDFENFTKLKQEFPKTLIVGDDLTTTNRVRMEEAARHGSINGVIIKPNQIGTLTEVLDAVRFARTHGWQAVVSHRSGDTTDDYIADLAWGIGAEGVKFGAPIQEEREVKYNRLVAIEKRGK
jgi:enolase